MSGKGVLEATERLYKERAPKGWAGFSSCDALLFASLHAVGCNQEFDIEDATRDPGQWFRSATQARGETECSSDISRDMFHGLLVYCLHFRRLDLLADLWSYGSRHVWKMGQERKRLETRTWFTPQMAGLLAEVIHHLGGQDHWVRHIRHLEQYNVSSGFVSHLTLLKLYLRGRMYGRLSLKDQEALDDIGDHMDNNPLVWALRYRYLGAPIDECMDRLRPWPADRLPTARDWHEEWRLQRSDGDSGLLSGDSDKLHSGGDFLFITHILNEGPV